MSQTIGGTSYPRSLLEAITTHSLLHMLGFNLGDVFLELFDNSVVVELRTQGKSLTIRVGAPELPLKELQVLWVRLIANWNTGGTVTKAEKDALFFASQACMNRQLIVSQLIVQGIRLPVIAQAQN